MQKSYIIIKKHSVLKQQMYAENVMEVFVKFISENLAVNNSCVITEIIDPDGKSYSPEQLYQNLGHILGLIKLK